MSVQRLIAASIVDSHTLTGDRVVATAAVLIALIGGVIGAFTMFRRVSRRGSWAALGMGITGMIIGGAVVATADGGPGTGNGIVGG
jgi:hypothetical protein